MKQHTLRELAKFGAGLVAGDFLTLWWLSTHQVGMLSFMGFTVSPDMVTAGLLFDLGLFITFIHYGWQLGKIPAMRERAYFMIAGILFAVIAVAHLYRLISNNDLILGGWDVPQWLSWVGIAMTTYLAYMSFRLVTRRRS